MAYKTDGKNKKLYFSTDIDLLPEKINEYYEKRFQAEAKLTTFSYIEVFYNKKRKHSALGYCTPQQFELKYYQSIEQNCS